MRNGKALYSVKLHFALLLVEYIKLNYINHYSLNQDNYSWSVFSSLIQREESALRALEEEREKEERRRRQAETKANLDRSFKLKMKRKVIYRIVNVFL